MGSAITRALVASGHDVRVWSRSPRTPADVGVADASNLLIAESPGAAVEGADLVVGCLLDHDASRSVVEQVAPHLDGQVVVNVSTGTPAQASASAEHAGAFGVRYVTGAVMVPTPLVGTDDCVVLYAGADADVEELSPLVAALAGVSDVVGPDHAVPPALDLAMLDVYFAGLYAHLHATALAAAHGIEPDRFLPYAQGIVETLGASLPDLTAALQQRTYDGGQARLDMCLSFLEHIVASSREAGIDPGIAELVRATSARAASAHDLGNDWDVVAEDFLPPRST